MSDVRATLARYCAHGFAPGSTLFAVDVSDALLAVTGVGAPPP